MNPDEIIATAMLLGAEFQIHRSGRLWRCAATNDVIFGTGLTGFYVQKHDAAAAYLKRHGYGLDFNGELQKI